MGKHYLDTNEELPPSTYFNSSGRSYPDISAVGSNVMINTGEYMPVGGTSASSPIVSAVITLLNDEVIKLTGKPLGFLNVFLYEMGEKCESCFNDITWGQQVHGGRLRVDLQGLQRAEGLGQRLWLGLAELRQHAQVRAGQVRQALNRSCYEVCRRNQHLRWRCRACLLGLAARAVWSGGVFEMQRQ